MQPGGSLAKQSMKNGRTDTDREQVEQISGHNADVQGDFMKHRLGAWVVG